MKEIWINLKDTKDFKDFENYAVSNYGNVKNIVRGNLMKPIPRKGNGATYHRVHLSGFERKAISVHRLVLMSFNPIHNSDTLTVNHIDENPFNNKLDNLEWLTVGDNIRYSHANKTMHGNIEEIGNNCIELEKSGKTITEAAKILNIPMNTLYDILRKNGFENVYKRKILTEADKHEILEMLKSGKTGSEISKITGHSQSTISNVKKLLTGTK